MSTKKRAAWLAALALAVPLAGCDPDVTESTRGELLSAAEESVAEAEDASASTTTEEAPEETNDFEPDQEAIDQAQEDLEKMREEATASTTGADGSRQNPADPTEHNAIFEDGTNTYTVQVHPADFDAWDVVAAENQFNEPPADGSVYVLLPVTFTYEGPESSTPWLDLTVAFVSADGRSFDEAMGVVPGELSDVGDLYDGGTAEGNLLFEVPSDAAEGGTWAVTAGWFADPMFFEAVSE